MKKSVYELEKSDYDKYLGEFNKTEFAKKSLKNQRNALYIAIAGFAILFLAAMFNAAFTDIVKKEFSDGTDSFIIGFANIIMIIGLLIYCYNYISLKICFYRWLKIKHNIEY